MERKGEFQPLQVPAISLLILVILIEVQRYLTLVLICTSPMTNNVGYLFMAFPACLEKHHFIYFICCCWFQVVVAFFFYSFRREYKSNPVTPFWL